MTQQTLLVTDAQAHCTVEGKPVPLDFPYLQVLLQGRPRHGQDEFSCRHPRMERGKRAKLFAPFDALDGLSEQLADRAVVHTNSVLLGEMEDGETAAQKQPAALPRCG